MIDSYAAGRTATGHAVADHAAVGHTVGGHGVADHTAVGHTFDLSVEAGVIPLLTDEELSAIGTMVLSKEGISRPCAVSISFVSDEHMCELNATWRGQEKPTDVLSLECERPNEAHLADGEPCELGDIVLASDYILRQAATLGTTPADECRILYVHGLLHLLGYDHREDKEAEAMEAREDLLLSYLHTDGDLGRVSFTRHVDE